MKPQIKKDSVDTLFDEAVAGLKSCSIDEVLKAVRQNPELVERIIPDHITDAMLKQQCRRLMKKSKDEFGFPRFMSVRVVDANGDERREYKQPQLFEMAEFQQTVDYYGQLTVHYAKTAIEMRDRCKVKFGKQIPLPFDETAILLD